MTTKQKTPTRKVRIDYDKENDIFSMNWGKVDSSIEICDGQIVLDINHKSSKVVGIEIFDIQEMIKKAGGRK